jgi:hypothetical protein
VRARFRNAARAGTVRVVKPWFVLFVVVAACGRSGGATIGDADRKKLDAAIAASEAHAAQVVEERTAALRAALVSPPAPAGACTFALPPPEALIPPPGGGPPTNPEAARTAKLHFSLVPAWALNGSAPPADRNERESLWARMGLAGTNHGQYDLSLTYIRDTVKRGSYDPGDEAAKLVTRIDELGKIHWDWELVIVTTDFQLAKETGDAQFTPGEITGMAILWSYADHKIRCAGPVHATSSDTVMSIKVDRAFANGKNGFLEADLEAQAFAAAVRGLHAT